MPAFDYSEISDLYDFYCTFAADIPFWAGAAARNGDVLELMAGTGRITIPLLRAGVDVIAVERDVGMASVLRSKARTAVVCADVLALPLRRQVQQVLLPFQGLSELASRGDRQRLFHEVAAVLVRGGAFVCTAHNPAVRSRTLNGEWQRVGAFAKGAETVEVELRGVVEGSIAAGEQRITVRDAGGNVTRRHDLPLRFSLTPLAEILELAERASLRAEAVFGSYDRAAYEESSSPAIIVVFRK